MKTIEMFTCPEFGTRKLLRTLIGAAPIIDGASGAYTTNDVHMAVKVLTALGSGDGDEPLILEDADCAWMQARIDKQQWQLATPDLGRMLTLIKNPSDG